MAKGSWGSHCDNGASQEVFKSSSIRWYVSGFRGSACYNVTPHLLWQDWEDTEPLATDVKLTLSLSLLLQEVLHWLHIFSLESSIATQICRFGMGHAHYKTNMAAFILKKPSEGHLSQKMPLDCLTPISSISIYIGPRPLCQIPAALIQV